MNRKLTVAAGIALCAGLAACSSTKDARQLSQKTVEYACGPDSVPLSAQYTFQGEQALAARVVYMNQVIELNRATASNADMVGNTFRGGGYTWTTDKFAEDDVEDAKGLMLQAIRDDNPVMFMFHKGIMGLPWMAYFEGSTTEVPEGDYTIPFGKARVVREGTDLSIVTLSQMTRR